LFGALGATAGGMRKGRGRGKENDGDVVERRVRCLRVRIDDGLTARSPDCAELDWSEALDICDVQASPTSA
jgi:hypothetical protein